MSYIFDLITFGNTITSYHSSIRRFLREEKYLFCLDTDKEFSTSRRVRISKRKELKQKEKGYEPNAAESEGNIFLQEKDCIGLNCPKELLNKTGLQNTMMFGIRGGGGHKLKWSDSQLLEDETDSEHLEFTERDTKKQNCWNYAS